MIFAAGLGTRLRPLTDTQPKALIEICGKPSIEYAIEAMQSAGIGDVVVNVHHHADMLSNYLELWQPKVKLHISDERECLLDTGGGVAKAYSMLCDADAVVLYNADILCDYPLTKLLLQFTRQKCDAMLLCNERNSTRAFLMDSDANMRGWINHQTGQTRPAGVCFDVTRPLSFCGIHVISPSVLELIRRYSSDKGPKFSITDFYINTCEHMRYKAVCGPRGMRWFDIGRPESLQLARQSWPM